MALTLCGAMQGAASSPVLAQTTNPVYMDASAQATDTFARVQDFLAADNVAEASRALQALLLEQPDRLVVRRSDEKVNLGRDEDLFVSVRSEVRRVLLENPALLEWYRRANDAIAQTLLAAGEIGQVESGYLLTTPGFEAALALGQRQMEAAQFHAAVLTIEQLQNHPDAKGERLDRAVVLAGQIARYIDSARLRSLRAAWGAPGSTGMTPVEWPKAAQTRALTPVDELAPADLSEVLGKPLRSAAYGGEDLSQSLSESGVTDRDRLPPFAKRLSVLPTVAGDTLYINDGASITAWDRITLTRRWKSEPIPLDPMSRDEDPRASLLSNVRQRGAPNLEEMISVSAADRDVVGATGIAVNGYRNGDPRVHGIDAATGLVRWSVNVPDLDPHLAGTSVRGPINLVEGTAVLVARRAEPERRQVAVYVVGLDVASGQLRWSRLLGSTGALPYRQDAYLADAGVEQDGIVYRGDMLGAVGAYEAATGRARWVRRIPTEPQPTSDSLSPWQMNCPVIWHDQLLTMSGDRTRVLRLDLLSGALLEEVRADALGNPPPRYVVGCGDVLVGVSDRECMLTPISSFKEPTPRAVSGINESGIRGRVVCAGERLLVPTSEGLLEFDPSKSEAPAGRINVDNPGNFLALDSQLIVVDDAFVHSYLLWEAAERVLTERMRADPAEPAAAVTMCELAYRAGRLDRIVPAADAALASISLAGENESAEASRARLFGSLHEMATLSLEPVTEPVNPPAATEEGPAGEAPPPIAQDSAPRITDPNLLRSIIERMARTARTPDEHVAHLLTLGRFQDRQGEIELAVKSYQEILDSPPLAAATWNGSRLSTRGELEVTRRLERLVREHGPSIYSTYDARANAELAALKDDASAEELLALASRYPVGEATPAVWERLADVYTAKGRGPAAISSLESGLEAAERRSAEAPIARLASRLVHELESRGQLAAASSLLRSLMEHHPAITLTIEGQEVALGDLSSKLMQRIAARHRWPRVGPATGEDMQVLVGWSIMEPIIKEKFGSVPPAVMLRSSDLVALWTSAENVVKPGDDPSARELRMGWTKPVDSTSLVELIRIDNESAYVFAATAGGASVEKVALSPMRARWQTEVFSQEPAGAAPPMKLARISPDERLPTPQDGPSLYTDLLTVLDERTLAFVERTGRACAIDSQTGEPLWTLRSPLDRAYDVALSPSALVISGDQEIVGAGGRTVGWRPEIVVLDPRTGVELQRIAQRWGQVRWIRLTDTGDLIAGCDQAIVSADVLRAQSNWVLSDQRVIGSRDAWIFGDSMFLLDRDRQLWMLSVTSGELGKEPLASPRAHLSGLRAIQAFAIPQPPSAGPNPAPEPTTPGPPASNVAFSTFQGVIVYGMDGTFKGIDAVGGFDGLLPPIPSETSMVTMTTMPDGRRGDGELIYTLHYLHPATAMLQESVPIVLGAPPRALVLMDGRTILTAGGTTLALKSLPKPPSP